MSKMLERMKQIADEANKKIEHAYQNAMQEVFVPDHIAEERLNICLSCDKLYKPTKSCKLCGCFMAAKTKLAKQACPVKKWTTYTESKN
jgi:hypothetical protein